MQEFRVNTKHKHVTGLATTVSSSGTYCVVSYLPAHELSLAHTHPYPHSSKGQEGKRVQAGSQSHPNPADSQLHPRTYGWLPEDGVPQVSWREPHLKWQ